jgi:hypothetical protein
MKTDPKTRKRRNMQKTKKNKKKAVKTDQKVPKPSQKPKKIERLRCKWAGPLILQRGRKAENHHYER